VRGFARAGARDGRGLSTTSPATSARSTRRVLERVPRGAAAARLRAQYRNLIRYGGATAGGARWSISRPSSAHAGDGDLRIAAVRPCTPTPLHPYGQGLAVPDRHAEPTAMPFVYVPGSHRLSAPAGSPWERA
jgi:hypothetical protein